MRKSFLNWSSGKDAAYSLLVVQQAKKYDVQKLVTTINSEGERVSMHGVPKDLLVKQAAAVGIPLQLISLPGQVPLSQYNEIMFKETKALESEGFSHCIFGDIFLEDLRTYREQQLSQVNIKPVFPLWKKGSSDLMREFLAAGFKAITVSVNAKVLDRSFCGRMIDEEFLNELPKGIDPAGEHGEYHSFVFDGPYFTSPVEFQKREIVERSFSVSNDKDEECFQEKQELWDNRFYYCDLVSKPMET